MGSTIFSHMHMHQFLKNQCIEISLCIICEKYGMISFHLAAEAKIKFAYDSQGAEQ